jgi:hypothetical protein
MATPSVKASIKVKVEKNQVEAARVEKCYGHAEFDLSIPDHDDINNPRTQTQG